MRTFYRMAALAILSAVLGCHSPTTSDNSLGSADQQKLEICIVQMHGMVTVEKPPLNPDQIEDLDMLGASYPDPLERFYAQVVASEGLQYASFVEFLGKHPDFGGQLQYVFQIAKWWARAGHTVRMITPGFDGKAHRYYDKSGFILERLPYSGTGYKDKYAILPYLKELGSVAAALYNGRKPPDVIISNFYDAATVAHYMKQQLPEAGPHVSITHSIGWLKSETDLWEEDDADSARTAFLQTVVANRSRLVDEMENGGPANTQLTPFRKRLVYESLSYSGADVVVPGAPSQGAILQAIGVAADKVRVIEPAAGYDPEQFFPASEDDRRALRDELLLPVDQKYMFAVGRPAENKGFKQLIDAFASLRRRYPGLPAYRLVLVSGRETDPLQIELIRYVREKGLESWVTVKPGQPNHIVAMHARAADINVFPSIKEPFGIVAIEELGTGVPTIISKLAGVAETLTQRQQAFLVDPFNADEFADAMAFMIQNPAEAKAIGERGHNFAAQRYTWRHLADALVSLMREMFSDRPCFSSHKVRRLHPRVRPDTTAEQTLAVAA